MLKQYLRLDVAFIAALTLALIVFMFWHNRPRRLEETGSASGLGSLRVSSDGSQSVTDVSGSVLQQAQTPTAATSGSELNPQQSVSNYTP
jgi:hypothetical protein